MASNEQGKFYYLVTMESYWDESCCCIKQRKVRIPVSKEEFDDYYKSINAFRRTQQNHNCCACPKDKRWLCNMDCWECEFRCIDAYPSLNESISEDDDTTLMDIIPDSKEDIESIVESAELLSVLVAEINKLDTNLRETIEMLLQGKTERDIALQMNTRQSTVNYRKNKALEILRNVLKDYF